LDSIPTEAFSLCSLLESIILPSSVKTLRAGCFSGCRSLANSPLPLDSEVVRIENCAFLDCSSLKSMVLPSSLEFVGALCFSGCDSLSQLTFSSPSRLRELLSFPQHWSGFVSIPDSVEIVSVLDSTYVAAWFAPRSAVRRPDRILTFGRDSRLTEFRAERPVPGRGFIPRLFLQLSSGGLKIFRMKLEFEGGS
jgi:hypothetical protein